MIIVNRGNFPTQSSVISIDFITLIYGDTTLTLSGSSLTAEYKCFHEYRQFGCKDHFVSQKAAVSGWDRNER